MSLWHQIFIENNIITLNLLRCVAYYVSEYSDPAYLNDRADVSNTMLQSGLNMTSESLHTLSSLISNALTFLAVFGVDQKVSCSIYELKK